MIIQRASPQKQQGAAAVEFALVAIVFFMLLFGVMEMARILFTWNSAVEATRYGARVAAVCDIDKTKPHTEIVQRMQLIMPNLPADKVDVSYLPDSCNKDGTGGNEPCKWVKVAIEDLSVQTYIPSIGRLWDMPEFSTTLPRESLDSANNCRCTNNPDCR